MNTDISKLNKQVERFCSEPISLYSDESQLLLTELLRAFFDEKDSSRRNILEQLIGVVRRFSDTDVLTYAHILHSIALEEYDVGENDFSEFLFRSACNLVDDSSLNNNLAYVLRRKRNDSINTGEVITLLLPGIKEQEPFCIINMGLLFAQNLSTPADWRTADDLFSLLPGELCGADTWWENLGKDGETEGYLVHFFLLRHNKIAKSDLGSIKGIVWRLTRDISFFPDWLSKNYNLESLDDVIDCMDDPDFNLILEDFLDGMPQTRESVDEMLEVISVFDLLPVYKKLLTDCAELLSVEEYEKAKAAYKDIFSLPLPGEGE